MSVLRVGVGTLPEWAQLLMNVAAHFEVEARECEPDSEAQMLCLDLAQQCRDAYRTQAAAVDAWVLARDDGIACDERGSP